MRTGTRLVAVAALAFLLSHSVAEGLVSQEQQPVGPRPREALWSIETQAYFTETPLTSTLHFPLCNGFANQRLALVLGLLLAASTDRTAVLPDVILNGVQRTGENSFGSDRTRAPFETFYSMDALVEGLQGPKGPRVVPLSYFRRMVGTANITQVPCTSLPPGGCAESLRVNDASIPHARVGCLFPAAAIGADHIAREQAFVQNVLRALAPAQKHAARLNELLEGARRDLSKPGGGPFRLNFLHLRVESDWLAHCARWEAIPDGIVRNNCMNNSFADLGETLVAKGLKPTIPLYVATHWSDVAPHHKVAVRDSLSGAGYNVVGRSALLPATTTATLNREEGALLEYYVGLRAHSMAGNSVSSFSAMMILERRARGMQAAYYNGGDIPLSAFVPLYDQNSEVNRAPGKRRRRGRPRVSGFFRGD